MTETDKTLQPVAPALWSRAVLIDHMRLFISELERIEQARLSKYINEVIR